MQKTSQPPQLQINILVPAGNQIVLDLFDGTLNVRFPLEPQHVEGICNALRAAKEESLKKVIALPSNGKQ